MTWLDAQECLHLGHPNHLKSSAGEMNSLPPSVLKFAWREEQLVSVRRNLPKCQVLRSPIIYEIESAGGNLSLEGVAKLAKCLKISMKDLMPDNEFDIVITSTGVVSAFDRAVEALQQAASALLSEVRGLTEFRERIERLVQNEPGQPDK
jgi:hypothetical protein